MNCRELTDKIRHSELYTLHAHTQFCDGRAPMQDFVSAAIDRGFSLLGFTPHSPVPVQSPCNMTHDDVTSYLNEIARLREIHGKEIDILSGMEVDFLSTNWGAHIPYFQEFALDYRLSSIHFIPSQQNEFIDIDGSYESFAEKMHRHFHDDIDYVVKKFFEQSHLMLELGGFEILGHFDKIAMNGQRHQASLTNEDWYRDLMFSLIDHIAEKNYIVEINTKAYERTGKFFPSEDYWPYLLEKNVTLIVNSDAHIPDLINASRPQALNKLHAKVRNLKRKENF